MHEGRRGGLSLFAVLACAWLAGPGCAAIRNHDPNPDLRPCDNGFARTADGWHLGIRHLSPEWPDPGKYPVVLCHGLGLNGTFWTITERHLPAQLVERGYEVFIVDLRGSGASYRDGTVGRLNRFLRQTPLLEIGEGDWSMDDEAFRDVPAILDYVQAATGSRRVNWIGHSLGGMLMYAYLEMSTEADRIATFVSMGATAHLVDAPRTQMLRANRGLRVLLSGMSTARLARPLKHELARPPGLGKIDKFYFTQENVDEETVSRFYGSTLENPGRGALAQMEPYLEHGHLLSADGKVDYAAGLGRIRTPTLLVAGEGDIMADIPSMRETHRELGSADKTLMRFGKVDGQVADYGHCDLVWSRHAPDELFPPLQDWLDVRQPGVLLATEQVSTRSGPASIPPSGRAQEGVDADPRPGLEPISEVR